MIERDADGTPVRFSPSFGTVATTPQDVLRSYYRSARLAWRDNLDVQRAAAILWMNEREYCDAYVRNLPPLTWTITGSTETMYSTAVDHDRAYREAKPHE